MQRTLVATVLAGTAFGTVLVQPPAAAELSSFPPSGEHAAAQARSVSANGSIVVGTMGPASTAARGFIWTEGQGVANVGGVADGGPANQNWFTANSVSNAGDVVVGGATAPLLEGAVAGRHAYRWTSTGGFVDLGTLGGLISEANGVSGDGSVVVGAAYDAGGVAFGFRWSDGEGMSSLGAFTGQTAGTANAASYDGSVIVGTAQLGVDFQAFRWTEESGLVALANVDKPDWAVVNPRSWAVDVSDDGRIIAGNAGLMSYGAVRWVDGVLQSLGSLPGAYPGYVGATTAYGISGNGEVVVGQADDGDLTGRHAFRWDEQGGMITVEQWLNASGASIGGNVTNIARATNCNGSVVVGELRDGQLFVARGNGTGTNTCASAAGGPGEEGPGEEGPGEEGPGEEGPGEEGPGEEGPGEEGPGEEGPGEEGPGEEGPGVPGLIGLDDLGTSLAEAGAANASVVSGLGLLLNGAGSRPLDRRTSDGKTIAWTGGDLGRDDNGARDGAVGLGEVGIGHNFGGLQVNGAIGVHGGDYRTQLGGETNLVSAFVKLEAMGELYATDLGGIWGVITGTALIGSADINRNYLANGGLVDGSSGRAGVQGFGIRGRLQWENALPHVSPYTEIALSHACLDGYTETGGSFPAAFDAMCNTAVDGRIGADVTIPVTDELRVVGTVELVQRLGGTSGDVTGEVLGLGAFTLPAAPTQQTWMRAGVGVQADIGDTTLSLMGNATTQGDAPSMWLAARLSAEF